MKAILLGTGATIGTLGTNGGVDGFVKRLNTVRPNWKRDYPELARVIVDCKEEPEQLGLDWLWTRIDYCSKFRGILGSDYGVNAAIQLRKAVLDAYSFGDEISQLCTATAEFTLKRVLRELSPGDALISFNWDTLAETIVLRMLGKDLVQVPYPVTNTQVRLIKPHGSLSWEHRSDAPVHFQEGSNPRLQPMAVESVHAEPASFAQPLVLGAVPIKSELLEEIQRYQFGLYETISAQWREVVDVLSRVTEIVVVGYRFPAEDAYGRFLFREAVLRRPKQTGLPPICYYALSKDREQLKERSEKSSPTR